MLEDLREKLRAIRQSYTDDLSQLMQDVELGRINGEEYRTLASTRRAKFFVDDKLVHAEMSERVKRKSPDEIPAWLSYPPDTGATE